MIISGVSERWLSAGSQTAMIISGVSDIDDHQQGLRQRWSSAGSQTAMIISRVSDSDDYQRGLRQRWLSAGSQTAMTISGVSDSDDHQRGLRQRWPSAGSQTVMIISGSQHWFGINSVWDTAAAMLCLTAQALSPKALILNQRLYGTLWFTVNFFKVFFVAALALFRKYVWSWLWWPYRWLLQVTQLILAGAGDPGPVPTTPSPSPSRFGCGRGWRGAREPSWLRQFYCRVRPKTGCMFVGQIQPVKLVQIFWGKLGENLPDDLCVSSVHCGSCHLILKLVLFYCEYGWVVAPL